MASGRINYNRATQLGQDIATVMRRGTQFREAVLSLALKVGRYNDANGDIVTDSGIASDDVQGFKDLLARMHGELSTTAVVAVGQGEVSMTRTLLDAMS